jgi:hypothetical protein
MIDILTTKLYIPKARHNLVPRTRLIKRLQTGTEHKLTLISAPPGFGKTTMLSEWILQSERCVTWVSLDEGDNDPVRFLSYFLTGDPPDPIACEALLGLARITYQWNDLESAQQYGQQCLQLTRRMEADCGSCSSGCGSSPRDLTLLRLFLRLPERAARQNHWYPCRIQQFRE